MNRIFSWLQNVILRQVVVVFLLSSVFFGFQAFSYGNAILADTVKTPEGIYYKGTPDSNDAKVKADGQIDNVQNNLKKAVDNIREKLNLDEPVPQSTKDFLKSTEKKVEKTVNRVTE